MLNKYGAITCPFCGSDVVTLVNSAILKSKDVRDSKLIQEMSKTADLSSDVYNYECETCHGRFNRVS